MLAVQKGLFWIRFHLVTRSKHHYHIDHSNFSRNFMIDAELYVPNRERRAFCTCSRTHRLVFWERNAVQTHWAKQVVRGDNSEIFPKAVLIIPITTVMHTWELYPIFSNHINEQRCHITNSILNHTKRLQKNSVSIPHNASQLKNKIIIKDHVLASTFPLCQNSAEDIKNLPLLSFLFSLFIYFIFYVLFSHFKYFTSLLVSTLFLSAFLSFIYSFPPINCAIKYTMGKVNILASQNFQIEKWRNVSIVFSLEIQIV